MLKHEWLDSNMILESLGFLVVFFFFLLLTSSLTSIIRRRTVHSLKQHQHSIATTLTGNCNKYR